MPVCAASGKYVSYPTCMLFISSMDVLLCYFRGTVLTAGTSRNGVT